MYQLGEFLLAPTRSSNLGWGLVCFKIKVKVKSLYIVNVLEIVMFTHGALRSSWELIETCPCVPHRIGTCKCWFLRRGENRISRRKTSRSKRENQQQTKPTYGVDTTIRTRATVVGSECSQHYATLAPLFLPSRLCRWLENIFLGVFVFLKPTLFFNLSVVLGACFLEWRNRC